MTHSNMSSEQDVRNEIRAKIEALDKLILGAGEFHDDPYEYVVPLRHIQAYRLELSKLDLIQPIYKDNVATSTKKAVLEGQLKTLKKITPKSRPNNTIEGNTK